ncbi:zinc finger protein 850-like [Diabrotica virgifera virgifera]|uniref:C2H2-type domain-containing protein n=1 Tax=Diabrotica virgifera virgifera TaxID=50390 RepID=A0ABM5L346_DIAVI|nr:zinc finger protein 850-like [Diabrotica virgifera virgifera]
MLPNKTSADLNVPYLPFNAYEENQGFKLHMRVHTGEKPYKCNFCNKAFAHSSVCNTHKKRIHGQRPYPGSEGEKPYSCSQCKKSFFNTASLMIHMRIHTGEKPYSCSMCKKAFSHASSLKIHMPIHNGERLYPCSECNKSFTDRTALIKHMRVHSKEKPILNTSTFIFDKLSSSKSASPQNLQALPRSLRVKGAPKYYIILPTNSVSAAVPLLVTSKPSPPALKVIPSHNQLLITTKTSPPVLQAIPKVVMASNSVGSRSAPSLKVIPTKELMNYPTSLSNILPNQTVAFQSKGPVPKYYANPFDYTPYVKNTLSLTHTQKIAELEKRSQGEQDLMQEKVFAWVCKICRKEFHDKELLMEHYEIHKNATDQLGNIDENNDTYNISGKEITCPICMTTYDNIVNYQYHVSYKHKPKDHNCGTCKHTFTDEFDLSIHNAKHNQDPKLYGCVICKEFQTKDTKILYEHISKEHVKEEMYCNECDNTFLSKTWFEGHKIFHTDISKRDTYKCGRCDSEFTSNYSLMEHMQESHTKYKCNECNVTFAYKKNLDEHNRHLHLNLSEERICCNVCGKLVTKKNLHYHERIHKAGNYVCSVCGKIFVKKEGLILHTRVHTGEKPYQCEICGKAFPQKSTYNNHMRIHDGDGAYPCSECNKAFYNGTCLRRHMAVHTGERPYPCSECKKSFSLKSNLRKHRLVHTGEKPYPCSICEKAFSQSSSLKTHMRIHTGEKAYPCSKCNKKFVTKGQKDVHEKKRCKMFK